MLIKWFTTNRELRRLAESLEAENSRLRQAISRRDQVIAKVQSLVRALPDMDADLDSKLMDTSRVIVIAIVLLTASVASAAGPVLLEIPKQRGVKGDSVLCEIVSYSVEPPFGNQHGRPTNAHETAHGIHATYRNKHTKHGNRVNAFYMGGGRVAIVEEPEFLIENIDVPESLRSYRYPLYFKQQLRYWNATPLYVLDEWTAYICGGETAVDDWHRCGIDTDEDSVSGCLEFSIYAVALYITAKERVPEYLKRDGQLKAVIGFNLTRAEAAFTAGRDVFESQRQDLLYEALQTHPAASEIRWCLRDEFGGAFLK